MRQLDSQEIAAISGGASSNPVTLALNRLWVVVVGTLIGIFIPGYF